MQTNHQTTITTTTTTTTTTKASSQGHSRAISNHRRELVPTRICTCYMMPHVYPNDAPSHLASSWGAQPNTLRWKRSRAEGAASSTQQAERDHDSCCDSCLNAKAEPVANGWEPRAIGRRPADGVGYGLATLSGAEPLAVFVFAHVCATR